MTSAATATATGRACVTAPAAVAIVAGLTVVSDDGRKVLDGIDLRLASGVTAILGESGAGKTTLAQATLGHIGNGLRRSEGVVEVAGRDPFTPRGRSRLRGRITGYLPQDPASALDPRRTALAQLRVAARVAHPGMSRRNREALIRSAADAAALEPPLLHRRPGALSGGQAQRALLAWTFVARPRLVILDEPTSGLDPETGHRVSEAFSRLPWNPAVLLITHDRALASRVADRVFELEASRIRPLRIPVPAAAALSGPTRAHGAESGRPDAIVVAEGLAIRRGGRPVLEGASLRFSAGELTALRGVSGAGKSSVARALCGLERPESGSLRVHGAPIPWDAASRARIGEAFLAYVGQDARAALNPHETVGRALDRAARAARHRGPGQGWDALTLMRRLALPAEVLERTPDRLSGGQRHRAALARALAARPAMLVLDETLAALDWPTAELVLDALDDWRRAAGAPVLLITHQDAVAARADLVLTLSERRIA